MTRIFMLVLAAGICVVGFQLFGPGGAWFRAAELEEALALQNEANRVQQDRNEALGAELYSLEHRRDAIEERARRELYMVKDDEVLFRLETPGEYEQRARELASMPDYRSPNIKPAPRRRSPRSAPTSTMRPRTFARLRPARSASKARKKRTIRRNRTVRFFFAREVGRKVKLSSLEDLIS